MPGYRLPEWVWEDSTFHHTQDSRKWKTTLGPFRLDLNFPNEQMWFTLLVDYKLYTKWGYWYLEKFKCLFFNLTEIIYLIFFKNVSFSTEKSRKQVIHNNVKSQLQTRPPAKWMHFHSLITCPWDVLWGFPLKQGPPPPNGPSDRTFGRSLTLTTVSSLSSDTLLGTYCQFAGNHKATMVIKHQWWMIPPKPPF